MGILELKKLSLIEEIRTSIALVKKGLGELQRIDGANAFYHLPILLLSSGYERLLKCLLCIASMDAAGKFNTLPFKPWGREGHDLDILLNNLLAICNKNNYFAKFPAAQADINLLTNNVHLRQIVVLLSEFAQSSRYYNLDVVLETGKKSKDPSHGWDDIEKAIIRQRPDIAKRLSDINDDLDSIYEEINCELVKVLEQFARALARLFVFADLGDFARQASPLVHDFLLLDDAELGTRKYLL